MRYILIVYSLTLKKKKSPVYMEKAALRLQETLETNPGRANFPSD
jgi:hypothetical protein